MKTLIALFPSGGFP